MRGQRQKVKSYVREGNYVFGIIVLLFLLSQGLGISYSGAASEIDLSAYLTGRGNENILDGEYDIRFALYAEDRVEVDPYPSSSDASIWEETQRVKITNGILKTRLGQTTPIPLGLDFSKTAYYLGIRVGENSEMIPRKRVTASPFAITALSAVNALNATNANNAQSLNGSIIGTAAGNLATLSTGGQFDAALIPKIKKLGAVSTGTWEADVIASAYIAKALVGKTYNGITITSLTNGFSLAKGTSQKLTVAGNNIILDQSLSTDDAVNFSSLDLDNALDISSGGTGLSNLGTANQILGVNNGGTELEYKTLTAGANITITNGAGSVTIAAASGSNYTAGGTLLELTGTTFSLSEGTLTNGRVCTYLEGTGLVCDTEIAGGVAYSAGSDLDLVGATFSLESTLDIVSTINLAGTGTINGLDAIDGTSESTLESTLDIAGDVTGTGLNAVTIAGTFTRDAEWNTQGEVETIWGTMLTNDSEWNTQSEVETIWGITLTTDSEWDSAAKINAATTDADFSLTTHNHSGTYEPVISTGTANYIWGMNAAGNAKEWKQLVAGTNVTINQAANAVTISAGAGTTYSASGTLLQLSDTTFSVKAGTLTDAKICTYSTANGLVCNTDAGAVGASYTAGNDLDLSGSTFNIESQLDYVSIISRDSADLTLQTTTSGNIILTPFGSVGIGTTNPNALLTVEGATSLKETTAPSNTSGYGKLYANSTDSKLYFIDDSGVSYDLTAGGTGSSKWTDGGATTYLTSLTDNLGIGTTSTSFKLAVAGDIGPSADNLYSLGSAENRFKDLFLGPDSIHMYNLYTDADNYEQGFLGFEGVPTQNSTLDFDSADEANFSQEDMAYDTTLTPSATSGIVTLTLGSGNWNGNPKLKEGTRVVGNGGVAIILEEPTASLTVTAMVKTAFNNTNAIAANSWHVYGTEFLDGQAKISGIGGNDSYTKYLLHSETTDGSTTFADSSASGHTINVYGETHHETDQSKFGSSSVYFDGTGDYLEMPAHADWIFGTGDYTIDFWIRPTAGAITTSMTSDVAVIDQTHASYGGWGIGIASGKIKFTHSNGSSSPWHMLFSNTVLTGNNWYHVAIVRSGTSRKMYINGVEDNSDTNADNVTANKTLEIGRNSGWGVPYIGYMEEIRISKGIARWTSNFTPEGPYEVVATDDFYSLSTSDTNQLNATTWSAITSADLTETLDSQEIYYSLSFDDRTTFKIYDTTGGDSGWRPIARNNSGTWQYNSNATAGATDITWTAATNNGQNSALSEAMSVAANQMSATELEALITSQWNSSGGFSPSVSTVDVAATLKTVNMNQIPSLDQITFNYQSDPGEGIMTIGTQSSGSGTLRDLQLKLGDTTAMYMEATNGYVGIGTSTPAGLFDVNGKFTVLSSGNVGIGNTNPLYGLDIAGDMRIGGGELYITGLTSSSSTTEGTMYYDTDNDNLYVYANGGWVDLTQQDTDTDTNTTYSAGNDLDLSSTTFNIESQLDYVTTISRASSNLTLQTTTSGNIILSPAGSVGIGTASPGTALEVNGVITATSGTSTNWNSAYSHSTATSNVHGLSYTAEGSGGGLDADTLDGFDSSAFGDATAANQTTILSRIGAASDAASMSTTLFGGQQMIADTLGTNDGDNTFDSSSVIANNDGSVVERLEYISGNLGEGLIAGSYFSVGGVPNYCKKKTISTNGLVTETNINNGTVCDTGKHCNSGVCGTWVCGTDQLSDIDGNNYNTVQIGTQCWMASNLNVGTKLAGGSTLPANNSTIEKWCYNNDTALCASEGGLYHWDEAMGYTTTAGAQGICPSGWHIPTDAQQHTLDDYLKDSGQTCDPSRSGWDCLAAGTKLKNGGSSGFGGLLAGNRGTDGTFYYRGISAYFWSSSETGSDAWKRNLDSTEARIGRISGPKAYGFSIRCLKD